MPVSLSNTTMAASSSEQKMLRLCQASTMLLRMHVSAMGPAHPWMRRARRSTESLPHRFWCRRLKDTKKGVVDADNCQSSPFHDVCHSCCTPRPHGLVHDRVRFVLAFWVCFVEPRPVWQGANLPTQVAWDDGLACAWVDGDAKRTQVSKGRRESPLQTCETFTMLGPSLSSALRSGLAAPQRQRNRTTPGVSRGASTRDPTPSVNNLWTSGWCLQQFEDVFPFSVTRASFRVFVAAAIAHGLRVLAILLLASLAATHGRSTHSCHPCHGSPVSLSARGRKR